jgi:hypothetical protein
LSDATRCREYILDTEKRIRDLLGIAEGLPRFTTELRGGFRTSDVALERVVLYRDDKVPLPGLLLVPTDTPRREPPIIYLGSRAKIGTPGERSDIWAPILKAGYPIFSFDPRGTGETEPAKDKERIPLEMIELESSLFAERVKDVLVAIAFVTGSQDGTARNGILIGEGTGGLLALHAAALSDRVSAVAAIRTIDRYDSLAEVPDVETPLSDVVPGVLSRYDLQDVVSTIAPRPVFLVNTVGGKGSPLRSSEIEAIYECPRKMADHLGEFFKHRSVPNAKIPKLVSDWIEKTRS